MLTLLYSLSVAGLLWIVLTEGTYLSPRLTLWFYRRGAANYQHKWRGHHYDDEQADRLFLSSIFPLATRQDAIRVLDVCCGTGRLARILTGTDWFRGSIYAFDASPDMLEKFKSWWRDNPCVDVDITIDHASVNRYEVDALPTLDVVSLLECSELLPEAHMAIERFARKLRPGGLLLMTKVPNWLSYFFPGRYQHSADLTRLLRGVGFRDLKIVRWRWRYQVVTAWKI